MSDPKGWSGIDKLAQAIVNEGLGMYWPAWPEAVKRTEAELRKRLEPLLNVARKTAPDKRCKCDCEECTGAFELAKEIETWR